jgi:YegS/Rv2252/BmrU family lipid kinase
MGNAWRQTAELRPIMEEFGGADWAGTVYPTHATELARQAADRGYELVIAVGGDGTIHEVINGLMQVPAERRPRLGIVPLGTGNDFSHNIGVTEKPPLALRRALSGQPQRIDIGVVEDEHGRREFWNNALGIGFDAIALIRSHSITLLRGFALYFTAAFQTILINHVAPKYHFSSDEENWEAHKLWLVVCNGPREGGGFDVAPQAKPDDGVFHYTCIGQVTRPMMFRLLPEVMKGTHERFGAVKMGTLKTLDLKADQPLYVHTDGEVYAGFGSNVRQLRVEILPGELEIML